MNAAFVKYPGHEGLVSLAFSIVTLNDALCEEPPPDTYELLKHTLNAFSAIGNKSRIKYKALFIVAMLLRQYPDHLPAVCDMGILACLINEVLEINEQQDRQILFRAGRDLVDLLKLLDKSQLEELSTRGVYKHLWTLLQHHENIGPDYLIQIIVGIEYFMPHTEFFTENASVYLLCVAKQFPSHQELQRRIWNLFTVHCKLSGEFTLRVLALNALDAAVTILQQNNMQISCFVLRFLDSCRKTAPLVLSQLCLKQDSVMEVLMILAIPDSCVEQMCNLLVCIIDCCSTTTCPKLFQFKLVSRLEDCARKAPQNCLPMVCKGIEKVHNLLSSDTGFLAHHQENHFQIFKAQFYGEHHHLFIQDMLANIVTSSQAEFVYTLIQRFVRVCPQEFMPSICTLDFVKCFTTSFSRHIVLFPEQVRKIVFTAHLFLFQIKTNGVIEIFRDVSFHTTVTNVIRGSESQDLLTVTVVVGLLSCLTSKYHEYLKDLKPLLDCHVMDVIIEKVLKFGHDERTQFGDDVTRILLTMTADKDVAQQLYKSNYLDKLLELLGGEFPSVVQRCVIHSIGNIALGGHKVKQVLADRRVHHLLLDILKEKADTGDPYLLSACGRLLHILASGDGIKREFVELGCVDTLLRVLRSKKDHAEVCWRALGLLSSLGFITAVHRRFVITQDVLDAVLGILSASTHGKVISYAALILLAIAELDDGVVRLSEMEVHRPLTEATKSSTYKGQGPDLERWAGNVMEKLSLYTVAVGPAMVQGLSLPPPRRSSFDWPPLLSDPFLPNEIDSNLAAQMSSGERLHLKPHFPVAVELDDAARQQLSQLGVKTAEPVFRVGRIYGSSYGLCSNCEMDGMSDELVIRTHGLTPHQYQNLIDNGWYRRGSVKMFRLRQNHRAQCCDWETRVSVKEFDYRLRKSYSKVLRRIPTSRLTVESLPAHFSQEAFNLYNEYHFKKHDKPIKSEYSYAEHAVNSPVSNQTVNGTEYGTYHQLYRLDGRLIAVGVIDIVPKGIVSVYMWYSLEKEVSKYSLGVYSALKEIEFVRKLSEKNPEMQYYYLQGWNDNNKKLAYKANYPPEEFYCACITPEWLPSLEAVKEVKEKYLKEHMQDQNGHPSCNAATPVAVETTDKDKKLSTDVPCSAFEKDRAKYQQLTGHKPDVSKMVVCLNYSTYMHLGEVFSKFGVEQSQRELMERRFEELLVAIGPELGANLVVDVKLCSSPE